MKNCLFYVKSLENDFASKTIHGKKKVVCQTAEEIIRGRKIKPNTKSFGKKKRLSCTLLAKNYLKTYRPQGIIFQTKEVFDYIIPFDLSVLAASNDIKVHYYKIQKKLHAYYSQPLIKGSEEFIFRDFEGMSKSISSPKIALRKANSLRVKSGFIALPDSKRKLADYNEAVFHKTIKITPIAVFGRNKKSKILSRKFKLPHYRSAKEFFLGWK